MSFHNKGLSWFHGFLTNWMKHFIFPPKTWLS
jgi:hypothetical protein